MLSQIFWRRWEKQLCFFKNWRKIEKLTWRGTRRGKKTEMKEEEENEEDEDEEE
jgi:hypothetical protein